jgi:uncharacterized protein (DUF2384 family)
MQLTGNIYKKDYLGFFSKDGVPNYQVVPDFLHIDKQEASQIAGVSQASVRYDNRIPKELADRFEEIANIANRVAELFDGDLNKASLWFRTANPMLGDISPRDMLRMNRFKRLAKFVSEAERAQ